jgi:hypothetical protein
MINQTPTDCGTLEETVDCGDSYTYGSEFIAGRMAMEQVINIRYTYCFLHMLWVCRSSDGPTYMFGDNKSVIMSSMIPHLMLGKRHNMLSYHRYSQAIAAGC